MRSSMAVLTLCAAASMAGGCGGDDASDAADADSDVRTMYVAHHQADCVGVGPMKCMLVKYAAEDDWTFFYDRIEGFEYEPGFEYELRVRTETVENPPADASSIRYILVELMSKTEPVDDGAAGSELVAGDWRLTGFSDAVLDEAGIDPTNALDAVANRGGLSIVFADGKVSGFSGCNQFTGSYTIEGGHSLSFGPLANTRKMCPPPLMDLEGLTMRTLETVESAYVRDGETLELYGPGETLLMTYARGAGKTAGAQVGSWRLDEFSETALADMPAEVLEAVQSLGMDEQTTVTLTLSDEAQASGFSGCNNYTGSYKTNGKDVLEFGPLAITMKACIGPGMAIESAFVKALEYTRGMKVGDSTLEFFGPAGASLVKFSRTA